MSRGCPRLRCAHVHGGLRVVPADAPLPSYPFLERDIVGDLVAEPSRELLAQPRHMRASVVRGSRHLPLRRITQEILVKDQRLTVPCGLADPHVEAVQYVARRVARVRKNQIHVLITQRDVEALTAVDVLECLDAKQPLRVYGVDPENETVEIAGLEAEKVVTDRTPGDHHIVGP